MSLVNDMITKLKCECRGLWLDVQIAFVTSTERIFEKKQAKVKDNLHEKSTLEKIEI